MLNGQKHMADKKDTITFDIPLLIRVLELIREDVKSDMDLHRVVETLISIREKGVLTMDDYDTIAKTKMSEAFKMPKPSVADKLYAAHQAARKKAGLPDPDHYKKLAAQKAKEIEDMKKEEVLDEKKASLMPDDGEAHITSEDGGVLSKFIKSKGLDPDKSTAAQKQAHAHSREFLMFRANMKEEVVTEGIGGVEDSPLSATNSVKAMESKGNKKDISKSARMIKSIYKKTGAKNPKLQKDSVDDEGKSSQTIVMTGGKTMTGSSRDTVTINPELKKPKNQV